MRGCPLCERMLDDKCFSKRGKLCRECAKMPSLRRKSSILAWLEDVRETLVCMNCGFSDARALHFHHLDPNAKETTVSRLVHGGASVTRIRREMEKCVVLCANCHAIEHAEDRNSVL